MYANIPETWKTLEHYGTQAIEAAVRFYNKAPDGQYDSMVADILRALLADMADGP